MVCKFCIFFIKLDVILSFYINYVVCKYHSLLTQETRLVRFILTMWYVNNSFKKEYTIFREGFILTMWYVNY